MKKYKFRSGFRIKGDAQVIGEYIEKFRDDGGNLSPEQLVKDAKNESSPLHELFEWNNQAAAREYRLTQARHLIRSLEVVYVENDVEIQTYAYVSLEGKHHGPYTSMRKVLSADEQRKQLYNQALRDLRVWRSKYNHIKELKELYEAIDSVL
jgi:hypothetical protein